MKEKRTRWIAFGSSDEDDKDELCSYPHVRNHAFGKRIGWTTDTAKGSTMLRHVKKLPVINKSMIYTSECFTYLPYHVGDEDLASISDNCYGANEVCYVIPPSHRETFEKVYATEEFYLHHLNDDEGGIKKIIAMENNLFNPNLLQKCKHSWRLQVSSIQKNILSYQHHVLITAGSTMAIKWQTLQTLLIIGRT